MRLIITFILSALVPFQAMALSCLPLDINRNFIALSESEKIYTPLMGRITYLTPPPDMGEELKKRSDDPFRENLTTPAQLDAQSLWADGFGDLLQLPVTIEANCVAHWCGGFPEESADYLFFVEDRNGEAFITMEACPGPHLYKPSGAQIEQFMQCAQNGSC